MIARVGSVLSRVFERTAPEPLTLAVLLTFVSAGLAIGFGFDGVALADRPGALVDAWRDPSSGIWAFLGFSMQMCVVLVSGHALAVSRPVSRLLRAIAGVPRSAGQAAAVVAFVAACAGVVNWGLGLIVGAVLAREVAKGLAARGIVAHGGLLAAAGYSAMLVWHGGLSGSAPVTMTTVEGASRVLPAETIAAMGGVDGTLVPLGDTVGSVMNVVATGGLLLIVPAVFWLLTPRAGVVAMPVGDEGNRESEEARRGVVAFLDRGPLLAWLMAGAFVLAVGAYVAERGVGRVGLNEINVAMLALGLIAHGSLKRFGEAVTEGAAGCGGIIVQFPLYAGIMGMLKASGLIESWSSWLASVGNETTLPLLMFVAGGVVNFFVPSGGGQWGIQGPIALEAGLAAGVAPSKMIMAVSYGDQLTNMLQPFWALPLLAITRVRAREIVGYTAVAMVVAACWLAVCLLVF